MAHEMAGVSPCMIPVSLKQAPLLRFVVNGVASANVEKRVASTKNTSKVFQEIIKNTSKVFQDIIKNTSKVFQEIILSKQSSVLE
jgi:hypothetical protein